MNDERHPTDARPPTTDHRPLTTPYWSSVVGRRSSVVLLITVLLLVLAACGVAPDDAQQPDLSGGNYIGPDVLARRFLTDLGTALKDPALADDTTRGKWASKLAEYFAPNERDDQRAALNTALASFADGLGRLNSNQTLTLELRFSEVQKLSDDGERALVRPVNGTANASIHLLIAHTDDRGVVVPEFEQEIGFDKIIGRSDGAIPTIRIGDRWYLTEG